jgi:hypothetical protein
MSSPSVTKLSDPTVTKLSDSTVTKLNALISKVVNELALSD